MLVIARVRICTCGPSETRKCTRRSGATLRKIPTVSVHSSSFRTSSRSKLSPSAGAHFAAHVDAPDGYAFIGCDVAPGFEIAEFHLTTRSMLTAAYPHLGPLIARYTR